MFEKAVELDPTDKDALGDLLDFYLDAPGFLGGGMHKAEMLAQMILKDGSGRGALRAGAGRGQEARNTTRRRSSSGARRNWLRDRWGAFWCWRDIWRITAEYKESDALFDQAARMAPNNPQSHVRSGGHLYQSRIAIWMRREKLLRAIFAIAADAGRSAARSAPRRCSRSSEPDAAFSHLEALRSSVAALRANKFRAFLTALGLVIGNASVILVVTISLTSRDYILERDPARRIEPDHRAITRRAITAPRRPRQADYVKIADVEAVRQQLGSRIVAATGVMNSLDRMRVEGPRRRHRDSGRRINIIRWCGIWIC